MNRLHVQEVEVEEGGRFIRAIALPYNQEAFVIGPPRRGGERVAHRERFDQESVMEVGAMFGKPILMSHDQTRPTGRILLTKSTAEGLMIEGELLGSDDELESIRRRASGGVLSSVSVGFLPSPRDDEWSGPDKSGLPLVLRRRVILREISLVLWPAFDGARILKISQRTAAAMARKESSDKEIAAAMAVVAEAEAFLKRRR